MTRGDDWPIAAEDSNQAERLNRRKAFCRLRGQDAAALADLHRVVERHADAIVDGFYEHLVSFEPMARRLSDPDMVLRLKAFQRNYLLSLLAGDYGETYAADRQAMGEVHERIGLEPDWYIGSYGRYVELLAPAIREHHAGDVDGAVTTSAALVKVMLLDMQLVLDAYYGQREKHAVERSERLAAVGELAASIAHEVRNPLAGMRGALEVLRKDLAVKVENQEIMDELLAQIDRLENLVRDLLTFARPRALRPRRFELHELLDRLVRPLHNREESHHVTVERTYGPGTGTMEADPTQMEQVFLNLIHNAIQAMDGQGVLSVSTRAVGNAIEVAFHDNGKGIDPMDLPRIFQPFFTTKHRGSGLGLSVVSKIVEGHGGSIEVDSQFGKGTTVRVRIPQSVPDDRTED